MKAVAAIVRTELLERRMALAAAAFAAVMPFLVPLARGLHGASAREARESLAFIVTAGFASVLALALGWSAISRDLADGRLGFYLSRPISGAALWAGKLGGAWILALAAAAVVWIPSWIASGGRTVLVDLPRWSGWAVLAAPAVLVVLAHAASITLRSRSALLLLDLAVLLLAAGVIFWLARLLLWRSAWGPLRVGGAVVAAAVLLGALTGGLAAVTRGRSDIRSAHRALSPRLWSGLAGGAMGFGAVTLWVLSAGPSDLSLDGAVPAPRGSWVAVAGGARGALTGFLIDTASGRYLRAGSARPQTKWWEGPSFSADGATAAWFEPRGGAAFELVTASLSATGAAARRTAFETMSLPDDLAVSPDGKRVALVGSGRVEVVDVATGRLLAAERLSATYPTMVGAFLGSDRFLAAIWGSDRLELFELDVPARRIARRTTILGLEGWYTFAFDASGERVLVRERSGRRLRLFDVRTGNAIATLTEGPAQNSSWALFLSDGRIVYLTGGDNGASLRLFSADGRPERSIEIPRRRALPGGEVAPGKFVFAIWSGDISETVLYLADLDSGDIRRVADGLYPVLWFATRLAPVVPGSDATELFYSTGDIRGLVRFDPLTGERRVILKGRKEG